MTALIPFSFEGCAVRVVEIDGDPWFVGKDVAERLGYTNPNKAMNDHCKGVTKRYPLQTPGGTQEVRILSEPDVLRLIVKSNLPSAERFERWVFEEVLPTIRRTGSYGAQPVDPMTVLNDPSAMRGLLLTYSEKVLALESANAELAPKAEALERIALSDGSLCITDAAKTLQVQPKSLFQFMRSHRWIYTRQGASGDIAYQDKLASGLLEHKTTTVQRSDGSEKTVSQVRVTAKGLARLAKEFPPAVRAA